MKHWKGLAVCLPMLLALAACGDSLPVSGNEPEAPSLLMESSIADTPRASGSETGDLETQAALSRQGRISLSFLRQCMEEPAQFAAAFLGRWEPGQNLSLREWLRNGSPLRMEQFPFLEEIPPERVLGEKTGEVYCLVPRDETASLAVNRVHWKPVGNGTAPEVAEVLYRSESGEPVVVFCPWEEPPGDPEIQVVLTAPGSEPVTWYPMVDLYGVIFLPENEDGLPLAMDFTHFGEFDTAWLAPTEAGLSDTSWALGSWALELKPGGKAFLYEEVGAEREVVLRESGTWGMENGQLRLSLSQTGDYPVRISPSGERLFVQAAQDGISPPFFAEDMECATLTLVYG